MKYHKIVIILIKSTVNVSCIDNSRILYEYNTLDVLKNVEYK